MTAAPLNKLPRRQILRYSLYTAATVGFLGITGYQLLKPSRGRAELPEGLAEMIARHSEIFNDDLKLLSNQLLTEVNQLSSNLEKDFQSAGAQFSKDKITRINIATMITLMARDSVDEGNRFDDWLEENLNPYFQTAEENYQKGAETVMASFVDGLDGALGSFNRYLAAELNQPEFSSLGIHSPEDLAERMQPVFSRQGLIVSGHQIVGLTLMTAGGITHLVQQAVRKQARRLGRILLRVLRPIALRVAARAVASGATIAFPPVGIAVSIVGGIWSGVDVIRLRGRAQRAFQSELDAVIVELKNDVDAAFTTALSEVLESMNKLPVEFLAELKRRV